MLKELLLRREDFDDLGVCVHLLRKLGEAAPVLYAHGDVMSPEVLTQAIARTHGLLERLWCQARVEEEAAQ